MHNLSTYKIPKIYQYQYYMDNAYNFYININQLSSSFYTKSIMSDIYQEIKTSHYYAYNILTINPKSMLNSVKYTQ